MTDNLGLTTATVTNPMNEDFACTWGGFPITVPANGFVSVPGDIAPHVAKHLANQMLITGGRYADMIDGKGAPVSRAVSKDFRSQLAACLINRDHNVVIEDVIAKAEALIDKEAGTVKKPVVRVAKPAGKPVTDFRKDADAESETAQTPKK